MTKHINEGVLETDVGSVHGYDPEKSEEEVERAYVAIGDELKKRVYDPDYIAELDKPGIPKISNEINATLIEKARHLDLRAEINPEEKKQAFLKAKEQVISPEFEWNGQTNLHILEIARQTRLRVLDELNLNENKPLAGRAKDLIQPRAEGILTGWMGERLAANISLRDAEAVLMVIEDVDGNQMYQGFGKNAEIHSVFEILNTTRKDVILTTLYLEDRTKSRRYIEDLAYKNKIEEAEVEKITNTVVDIMYQYEELEQAYKQQHPDFETIQMREIVREAFNERQAKADAIPKTKAARAAQNNIINAMFTESDEFLGRRIFAKTGKPSLLNSLTPKEIEVEDKGLIPSDIAINGIHMNLRELLQSTENSYFGLTVPDALIENGNDSVKPIEVKMYDEKYMVEYLESIARITRVINVYKKLPIEQRKDLTELGYLVNGIQIIETGIEINTWEYNNEPHQITGISEKEIPFENPEHNIVGVGKSTGYLSRKTYGPDIEGERRFAQLYNGSNELIPVVVRLPNDITDAQIETIYNFAKLQGITNFVIQRLPVSIENVKRTAANVIAGILESEEAKNAHPDDIALLKHLAVRNNWTDQE